jgi:hypothetical protein
MRCRRGFGEDDWVPADSTTPTDRVIDERPSSARLRRDAGPRLSALPIYLDLRGAFAD